jgi:tetratricopeptide (TPR) repeat protein
VLALAPAPAAPDDPGRPAPAAAPLGFAESLFAEGDYYRAISEYKRFLFEHPGDPVAPWVRFRIAEAYLAGGRTETARDLFAELRLEHVTGDARLRHGATLAEARAFYLEGRLVQAAGLLRELEGSTPDLDLLGQARYLSGCVALRGGATGRARTAWLRLPAAHPLAERALELVAALDLPAPPSKSPLLAGLLSVIPGLGHLYLGEVATGLTAFAWNGLFGAAVFDSFRRGQIGAGSLLAVLELLWYSGTIYGAVAGAERYNRDARESFLERLDRQAGLDIPFPDSKAASVVLLEGRF